MCIRDSSYSNETSDLLDINGLTKLHKVNTDHYDCQPSINKEQKIINNKSINTNNNLIKKNTPNNCQCKQIMFKIISKVENLIDNLFTKFIKNKSYQDNQI